MKIGVITFSDFNTNYGSMLQAFAMKRYLEDQGHEVVFIRYREFNKTQYAGIRDFCISNAKRTVLSLYRFIHKKDIQRTKNHFEQFKEAYIPHTPLCVDAGDFAKLPQFDCYICGSDQIWNLNCLGGLRRPYFLNFAPKDKCKIAYAASMGDYQVSEVDQEEIAQLINLLDFVSVRELESVSQLQKITGKEICHVVDPVFLLDLSTWDAVSGDAPVKGEYAVCYLVRRSKLCQYLIHRLSEVYHVPIINLSDNQIYIRGTVSKYIASGPLEFVSLIKNAKFAVGTSFHLAAFSIIFGVPFLIAGMESNRNRLNNLLSMVGLERNFVTSEQEVEREIVEFINRKPDYSSVQKKITESKRFLEHGMQKFLD